MTRRPLIDLFCEDSGHESFARAIVHRLANEAGVPRPQLQARSARGGHGRAISELREWQRVASHLGSRPDLLLVLIDANGDGHAAKSRAVEDNIDRAQFPHVVIACPDPHVEAWCSADLPALETLFGARPPPPPKAPGRRVYKDWLRAALEQAGVPILGDPMDIASDLVPDLDLYRAGKESPSLKVFLDGVRWFYLRFKAAEPA